MTAPEPGAVTIDGRREPVDRAGRLVNAAVWLLPANRREWGAAMRAELAYCSTAADRREFAWGCLRASLGAGQLVRLAKFVAVVAVATGLALVGGTATAVRVEVIALGVLAPIVVWRLGRGDSPLGTVGAGRTARSGRRITFGLAGAGFAVATGYLSGLVPPQGTPVLVLALALLAAALSGYTAIALWLTGATGPTDARSRATAGTLVIAGVAGTIGGIAWSVLRPFDQSLVLPGNWSVATLALITVGLPGVAAGLAARRGRGRPGQSTMAGAAVGTVAGLVILILAGLTLWRFPTLLDSGRLDTGPDWRPPDLIEQVIPGYFGLLLVAPALGALVGWLVGRLFAPDRTPAPASAPVLAPMAGRFGAAVTLALVALLAIPYSAIVGSDGTRFGGVGTTSVTFSPAGGTLLTSNADYTWILWNISDPARPVRLATFNDQVRYAPDGRSFASRNTLWDLTDPTRPVRRSTFDGGGPVAYSPDGRILVTHADRPDDDDLDLVWDVTDPAHPVRLSTFDGGETATFTPDGRTVFADDGELSTGWSLADPRRPRRLGAVPGSGGVFGPDGHTLATWSDLGLTVWDITDPARPVRLGDLTRPSGHGVAISSRSLLAVVGDDDTVRLWRRDLTLLAVLPAPPGVTHPQLGASDSLAIAAFSADGNTLSMETGNTTASRWDVTDPTRPVRLATVIRSTDGPGVVAYSPDQTVIAGAATDASNSVSLWRVG